MNYSPFPGEATISFRATSCCRISGEGSCTAAISPGKSKSTWPANPPTASATSIWNHRTCTYCHTCRTCSSSTILRNMEILAFLFPDELGEGNSTFVYNYFNVYLFIMQITWTENNKINVFKNFSMKFVVKLFFTPFLQVYLSNFTRDGFSKFCVKPKI